MKVRVGACGFLGIGRMCSSLCAFGFRNGSKEGKEEELMVKSGQCKG